MQIDGLRIIAPSRYPGDPWNEAEVLGAAIWLWSQHPDYQKTSIESALQTLLPIIASRKFCLFVEAGQPLGYVNWAYLSEVDESAYVCGQRDYAYYVSRRYEKVVPQRLWMLTWFFPKAGSHRAKRILRDHIMQERWVYYVYHRSPKGVALTKRTAGLPLAQRRNTEAN